MIVCGLYRLVLSTDYVSRAVLYLLYCRYYTTKKGSLEKKLLYAWTGLRVWIERAEPPESRRMRPESQKGDAARKEEEEERLWLMDEAMRRLICVSAISSTPGRESWTPVARRG